MTIVTHEPALPTQAFGGVKLVSLANPALGATDAIVLRGLVSVGAEFPAHSHDRQEILIFLSGKASYTIGEEQGIVSAGDVVTVPARALHAFEALEDIDAIAVLPTGARTFAPDGTEMESRV
jgi:quercetin dioxygenase-like cupin family protein